MTFEEFLALDTAPNTEEELQERRQCGLDRVIQRSLVEKAPPSFTAGHGCMYKGDEGRRCYFAMMLREDELELVKEGSRASLQIAGLELERFFNPHTEGRAPYSRGDLFWDDLQSAHDGPAQQPVKFFHAAAAQNLEKLADKYDLTFNLPVPS